MMLTYEFPLNEKSRTYLRFDALFQQLKANQTFELPAHAFSFFRALFDFIELSERCDIRTDLMKDLVAEGNLGLIKGIDTFESEGPKRLTD